MKTLLLEYLKNCDKKTGVRYLYKRNPELWQWVLSMTTFLPEDAKPKQRVWHIVNDTFSIQMCPVENVPVKWYENRYLTYISLSAKARCSNVTAKRLSTYKKKTGHTHWNSNDNPEGRKKYVDTCFERFNGNFPAADPEVAARIEQSKIERGIIRAPEERDALTLYNEQVELYTKDSWYYSYSRINPDGLERGKEYHLDHIYSRKAGFDNKVPPEVIGHWTNLQMLPAKENNGKSSRCDKSIEQLYKDYKTNKQSVK